MFRVLGFRVLSFGFRVLVFRVRAGSPKASDSGSPLSAVLIDHCRHSAGTALHFNLQKT